MIRNECIIFGCCDKMIFHEVQHPTRTSTLVTTKRWRPSLERERSIMGSPPERDADFETGRDATKSQENKTRAVFTLTAPVTLK